MTGCEQWLCFGANNGKWPMELISHFTMSPGALRHIPDITQLFLVNTLYTLPTYLLHAKVKQFVQ